MFSVLALFLIPVLCLDFSIAIYSCLRYIGGIFGDVAKSRLAWITDFDCLLLRLPPNQLIGQVLGPFVL